MNFYLLVDNESYVHFTLALRLPADIDLFPVVNAGWRTLLFLYVEKQQLFWGFESWKSVGYWWSYT